MAKKLTFGNTILCDYAGHGSNNKHVLVNVYSGEVIINAMPAELNLAAYIEINQPAEAPLQNMTIEVVYNGKAFLKANGRMEGGQTKGIFVIPMFTAPIDVPADLEFFFTAEGYARTCALRKAIKLGDVPGAISPSALLPPSEQSQPDAQVSSKPHARRRPSSPKL